MLARYWKWSATKEYLIGNTSNGPSAGASVRTKKPYANAGLHPARRRTATSTTPRTTAPAGNTQVDGTPGSISQRG
jgi:hypothetical protein